jgi:hypothetical protein
MIPASTRGDHTRTFPARLTPETSRPDVLTVTYLFCGAGGSTLGGAS